MTDEGTANKKPPRKRKQVAPLSGDAFANRQLSLFQGFLANTSDESNFSARASCRHRLVGAFAPRSTGKLAAQYGFARLRNAVELDDHVGIRAADDEDFGFSHRLASHT